MKRSYRILGSLLMVMIPNASTRVKFLKKFRIFGYIGNNVHIQGRKIPLHSELIYINNNVKIASNVMFVTHDIIHKMLNDKFSDEHFVEKVGCIEIMDNVFIGSGTQIMYNTKIGTNVIIGAGSIVTKDIPDNSVYAGVPARYICSFDDYVNKARDYSKEFSSTYHVSTCMGMNRKLATDIHNRFLEEKKKCY